MPLFNQGTCKRQKLRHKRKTWLLLDAPAPAGVFFMLFYENFKKTVLTTEYIWSTIYLELIGGVFYGMVLWNL